MDEATGYQIQNYRSPVKRHVKGGLHVETADLNNLVQIGAALVEVMDPA